ncbi:MAG: DNA gyrase subunit A [Methanocalculus sp. MSAO_Arc2]|uniref:DNA gyrase subunit A n=1 Tax=Methanocalculus sp. MSAO_Arc2 TaxID=2293855 RepID=UPI000FF7288D|nr:MAG: DNA gyrase subunit A [Methanocalculus sp. MSAO_Arc2]
MTSEESPAVAARVISVAIEDEMKRSYIDYAMSVIIGRAIPDVRDGLKPVHRRTLYAMWESGNTSDKPFRKSVKAVAATMENYHPHGDAAIYDTLVKMAQPFSYRYMLVEGQGNFGSIDGDSAAAMRYTEARLTKAAEALLIDIEKETVDYIPNFDGSTEEPVVLPARIPNLLVNGTSGIAVGMATNMPPHNLGEVCTLLEQFIENPDISAQEILSIMPGPDFPTGGMIMGSGGILNAYSTGYGRVVIRGVSEIETGRRDSERIIITEIPYQVNKARMIENIAELVRDKKLEGISDLRDESDKDGIRIVIELKKGINAQVILNLLYKHTQLQTTFGVINLSIVNGQPKVLPLADMLRYFLSHRVDVIRRRSEFELKKARDRFHVLLGLLIALDHIDEVIATIRASASAEEAGDALISRFGLDEIQADAILKMQLRRLAALEHQKILDEKKALETEIDRLMELLSSEANILALVKQETREIRERFSDPRRTEIAHSAEFLDKEALIEEKKVFVALTEQNYIKRMPIETYRQQRRGGRGVIGMSTKEEDCISSVFVASTHDYLLCFSDKGRAYWLKVYDIPEGSRTSRGKAIVNLLNINNETIQKVISVSSFRSDRFLFFATRNGTVVKIPLDQFSHPRQTGINAIKLRDGDSLVDVKWTDGNRELILTTRHGQSLRFHENAVRAVGRGAMGVRGISLRDGDHLQAVTVINFDHLLTITEKGYGKRTEFEEFRGHGRGTLGVRNIITDIRSGMVVASRAVSNSDEIIVMTASGIVIRTRVDEIAIQKRSTRGVRIIRLDEGDRVTGFAIVTAEMLSAEDGDDKVEDDRKE